MVLVNQKLLVGLYTLQFFKYRWFNNEQYMKPGHSLNGIKKNILIWHLRIILKNSNHQNLN